MFAIKNSTTGFYLKSTKRDKMVEEDKNFKRFSKRDTAEYWIKELGLKDCSVFEIGKDAVKSEKSKIRKSKIGKSETEDDSGVEGKFDPYYLFKKLNKQCLNCSKECKQSSKADIIKCDDYKTHKLT